MNTVVYYPTMAVFLDDSERFLTQLALELIDENLPYRVVSHPQDALSYIKKYCQYNSQADIDYTLIYKSDRFNQPSVLIVDYDMPGTKMDGFIFSQEVKKLCKELNIHLPKIILLTGQASENITIEGFNKGYMDRYISKNDPVYGQKLNETIQELQMLYFIERSAALFNQLSPKPSPILKEDGFLKIFSETCVNFKIVEWHMVSPSGDFLLLTKNGEIMWLVVITPEDVKNGHKKVYMQNAKEIKIKDSIYYYAVVTKPDLVPVQIEKICSLRHYLERLWPPSI